MADKVFIADKATLDAVKADTSKIVTETGKLVAGTAGAKTPMLGASGVTKLVQESKVVSLNTEGTANFVNITGSGYLYYTLIQLLNLSGQLKITIDGTVVFHRSNNTGTSSAYGGVVNLPALAPANTSSREYRVPGTGTDTLIALAPLSRGLSSSAISGNCDVCYLPLPIRFEKSLTIQFITTVTGSSGANLYYSYLLD
jgi:hypothetical protein